MRYILLFFAIKYHGDWEKVFEALKKKEKVAPKEIEKLKTQKLNFLTIVDEFYPNRLKKIYKPPFVIFYKGNIDLLKYKKGVAIIGSHQVDAKTFEVTKKFVSGFNTLLFQGWPRE